MVAPAIIPAAPLYAELAATQPHSGTRDGLIARQLH